MRKVFFDSHLKTIYFEKTSITFWFIESNDLISQNNLIVKHYGYS
mgnify:CR=1 FL=1